MKAGDVVQLKSGGPAMTIEKIFNSGSVQYASCAWFEKADQKSHNFVLETLILREEAMKAFNNALKSL